MCRAGFEKSQTKLLPRGVSLGKMIDQNVLDQQVIQ